MKTGLSKLERVPGVLIMYKEYQVTIILFGCDTGLARHKYCLWTISSRSQVKDALYISSNLKLLLTSLWLCMQIKLYNALYLSNAVKNSAIDILLFPEFPNMIILVAARNILRMTLLNAQVYKRLGTNIKKEMKRRRRRRNIFSLEIIAQKN